MKGESQMESFYGFKKQTMPVFDSQGKRLVITKISTLPLVVVGLKKQEKDGYTAIRVAIGQKRQVSKPIRGSLSKLNLKPRFIKELKADEKDSSQVGSQLSPSSVFQVGDKVKVWGVTKGKGFAGVVKRWGFKGGPRTHGQSDRPRAPGAIGQGTSPGRIWKGKKMAGHMGMVGQTVWGLQIVKIDLANQEIWVKGLVPGHRDSLVKITKTGAGKFVGLFEEKAGEVEKVEKVGEVDKEKGEAEVNEADTTQVENQQKPKEEQK